MRSHYAACYLASTILLIVTPATRAQPAAPQVTVSAPVQRTITEYREFTGQFSGIR